MERVNWRDCSPANGRCAVALGKFDGIHRGHRILLKRVMERQKRGERSAIFAMRMQEQMILSSDERADLLSDLGLDLLVECRMEEDFKNLTPRAFAEQILVDRLGCAFVTVGEDFRFGRGRSGDAATLKRLGAELGFEVSIEKKLLADGQKISSSRIREALAEGQIQKANELLGIPYRIDGRIVHGKGLGHVSLLPTVNLSLEAEKLYPRRGVYAVTASLGGRTYPGVTNVGLRPTVSGKGLSVETNLIGAEGDLYGEDCRLCFFDFLRPERSFASLKELKGQLLDDREQARARILSLKACQRGGGIKGDPFGKL